MKTLSIDLRQRIAQAYNDQEGSIRQLARRFKVSKSSTERVIKLEAITGSVAPKPHGGGRAPIIADQVRISAWLEESCDLTQEQLAERFRQATGHSVSRQTVGRSLRRFGITRKKSP